MESLAHVVKVSLPRYLQGLPIPETFGGIFRLSLGDWVSLTPFFGLIAGTTYLSLRTFFRTSPSEDASRSTEAKETKAGHVNQKIKKNESKVVDSVDIEDIGDKKVFCRCWKSDKFPYCDGSHNRHNEETGDNLGPLIIKK